MAKKLNNTSGKSMPKATVKGEIFKPEVGWLVSNTNANVYMEPVIEVRDDGFICKQSGRWTGTMEGWISHSNIKPKSED